MSQNFLTKTEEAGGRENKFIEAYSTELLKGSAQPHFCFDFYCKAKSWA